MVLAAAEDKEAQDPNNCPHGVALLLGLLVSRIKPTLNPESGSVYQWTTELEFSGTNEETAGVAIGRHCGSISACRIWVQRLATKGAGFGVQRRASALFFGD